MGKLRCHFAQAPPKKSLDPLPNMLVQRCPVCGSQPPIGHFAVERMDKFVTRGNGTVRQLLRAGRAYDVMPACQLLAEVFEGFRDKVRRRGADLG